jgi:HNH endonuclease
LVAQKVGTPTPISRQRPTYYSVDIRKKLWQQAQATCQFVDRQTGRRCESKFHLQIDHCLPVAMGGKSDFENLRLLCQTHNLLMAERSFRR